MPARRASGGSSQKVVWTRDTLGPGLKAFPAKLDLALKGLFQYEESNVQDYMRNNAPWTDRTSNARGGLFAKAMSDIGNHSIICYHTVPYGIWLEVANGGAYQIILPTIQAEGARIMGQINKLLSRMT